jgi:hypothetical protein
MKAIVVLNVIVAFLAVCLIFYGIIFVDLDVRSRYVQLDRTGVINVSALSKFHPSYGFSADDHRITVPRYIAGPALDQQMRSAILLLGLALTNIAIAVVSRRRGRIAPIPRRSDPSGHTSGATNTVQTDEH